MIGPSRAARLKPVLEALVADPRLARRVGADPVELPHRYVERADIEVAALLASSLAYGRVDLFKPKVEALLGDMGPSPAAFLERLTVAKAASWLKDFVYRFNVGTDVAVLLMGIGHTLSKHGTLEALLPAEADTLTHEALVQFMSSLKAAAPLRELERRMGPCRGLSHLLPTGSGAHKRLNLCLRWLVRGPDAVDFGLWTRVRPSMLVIPLDTHIARVSKHLGLTQRNDLSWATAVEITGSLRRIDANDPVRFDFALCHFGMSGLCPLEVEPSVCATCALRAECDAGRRLKRPAAELSSARERSA